MVKLAVCRTTKPLSSSVISAPTQSLWCWQASNHQMSFFQSDSLRCVGQSQTQNATLRHSLYFCSKPCVGFAFCLSALSPGRVKVMCGFYYFGGDCSLGPLLVILLNALVLFVHTEATKNNFFPPMSLHTACPAFSICAAPPTELTAVHTTRGWKVTNCSAILCCSKSCGPAPFLVELAVDSGKYSVSGSSHLDSLPVPGFLCLPCMW